MARAEKRVVTQRYIRPPGALPEGDFLAACTRCSECVDVCPPKAIIKVAATGGLAAGTPYLHPLQQPCVVCTDMPCAAACPTDADRKSTRLNSSHTDISRMPASA